MKTNQEVLFLLISLYSSSKENSADVGNLGSIQVLIQRIVPLPL